jgi:hypothetical protein
MCGPCRDVRRTVQLSGKSQLVEWIELVGESVNRWGSVVVRYCSEKLVAEVREQFETPEEVERPPLHAVTRQDEDTAG